ncbi:uncharacterized protein F5Z01DRAFT_224685 [Emericellopsis atlantica]|uniref:Rhodopsin domain-containing protein n=1 Tax=Emericellopsis atlantica TaxID=2614577 RepID=A0A9P7ZIF5_9HYPO|nr:uncharacterized protein F5Z01DRAFT_224685 [Emericellopsis atlantica]KAG9252367.1 hypothetical protein F5Z01DRAFT_224685 [Emericellopsis atlantica]
MGNPYFDPEYQPYTPSVLIGTSVLFMILPIAAVALRFYSRSLVQANLAIDDWITIPSAIICIGLAVNQIIAAVYGGLGGHQELVDGQLAHTEQLYAYEKTKYTYHVLGTLGLWVIKLSVLLFYRRIFQVRIFRIVNDVFIGLTVAWGLAFTFAVAFQCWPAHMFWEAFESEYPLYCVNVKSFYLAVAVSDLILDIMIFVLPMPHLATLKMPWRRKLAVGGIFFLGSIVVAIGIVRLIIFQWVIELMDTDPMIFVMDATWYSAGVLFWHLAENVIGLIGCCLPTYRPFFKRFLPKLRLGSSNRSTAASKFNSTKSKNSEYQRQHDDDWPLSRATAATGGSSSSSTGDEEHALGNLPRDGILVSKEFGTDSTIVHDGQPRAL